MDFFILLKLFLMDKTRTIGQICLANELDLQLLTLKKLPKANPIDQFFQKLSCIQTDRQTPSPKTIFSHSGGLKTWRFDEKRGAQILHKSNTFSDENVKSIKKKVELRRMRYCKLWIS